MCVCVCVCTFKTETIKVRCSLGRWGRAHRVYLQEGSKTEYWVGPPQKENQGQDDLHLWGIKPVTAGVRLLHLERKGKGWRSRSWPWKGNELERRGGMVAVQEREVTVCVCVCVCVCVSVCLSVCDKT